MKKMFFLMAAVAAMILSSCANEVAEDEKEMVTLTIKLSGIAKTRAVEAPAAANQVVLSNGYIFVMRPFGEIEFYEPLNVAQATGTGQTLTTTVLTDWRVYIIGNVPSTVTTTVLNGLSTFADIQALASYIGTQTDYKQVALANSDGLPAIIGLPSSGVSSVNVSIKPLISRLELGNVSADPSGQDQFTAFAVTGVFLDDYFPDFTFGGGHSGSIFSQGVSTTFTGVGDIPATPWVATGTPLSATPAGGDVWAYNVASGDPTRLIIRLTGVKYNPAGGGAEVDLSANTYYLTVWGYGTTFTIFERGKVYRTNIIFKDHFNLSVLPNNLWVDLVVQVTVEDWDIVVLPDVDL